MVAKRFAAIAVTAGLAAGLTAGPRPAAALEELGGSESFLFLHDDDPSALDGRMFRLDDAPRTGESYGFSIAPGLDLGLSWGLEINVAPPGGTLGTVPIGPSGGDLRGITIEGKVDLDTGTGLTPYLVGGAGLGFAGTPPRTASSAAEEMVTTFGIGTGVTYGFTPRWDVEVGYRALFSDGQAGTGLGPEDADTPATSHTLDIGLRYRF